MRIPQPTTWVPDWARQAVFYHLYPIGFLDAPHKNPRTGTVTHRLDDLHQWLDHITDLGVTAIQFGPLFESGSHGYDTIDYYKLDERLGDLDTFRRLRDALHERGLRVILDGVFNHVGRGFFAFQDVCRYKQGSTYADWFHINWEGDTHYGDGFDYEGWDGHRSLPRLNHANPAVREYLFGVMRFWLNGMGIDGWRLDVAEELPPDFVRELSSVCKTANPDCFLVGEVVNSDYREFVNPEMLDSGTDYQLHTAARRAINDSNLHDLRHNLDREYHIEWGAYRELVLMNFLSNHDITRMLSDLREPRHIYPALVFLMTAPGIPSIYYGDEIGMQGRKEEGDHALRPRMPRGNEPWPDLERNLYREIQRLIWLRRKHISAFGYGRFSTLTVSDHILAYLFDHRSQVVIVVISIDDDVQDVTVDLKAQGVQDGVTFHDVLNGGHYVVHNAALFIEEVYPNWGRIFVARR